MTDFNKLASAIMTPSSLLLRTHFNASCLRCNAVLKEMSAVGPMVFCNHCFNVEFGNSVVGPRGVEIDRSSEKYKHWLKTYKELVD